MRILSVLLATLLLTLFALPALAAPGLWRVADADTEVWLFGTLHELPRGTGWQDPRIMERFKAADTLVVEVDLPEDPLVLAGTMRSLGIRDTLPPLVLRVPADRRAALTKAITSAKLPIDALNRMKTWMAAIALSDGFSARAGLSPEAGVDTTLMKAARAANKPIVGLETIEQQLGFFDGLTEADQRALLLAMLDDAMDDDAQTLVRAWLDGDTAAIAADYEKELRTTPELLATLVSRRNARWADWIVGVMKRPGKVFIAVGAGHLAGADNLQSMLEARGLTVERVP